MKHLSILFFFLAFSASAQTEWPRTLETKKGGKILIYQPQPESLKGGKLTGRAAVSVREIAGDEPVFGAIWYETTLLTDRDSRLVTLESIKITHVKLPGVTDSTKIKRFTVFLESEIPKWKLEISMDELLATIEEENGTSSEDLKNDPPKVIYSTTPSTLVMIDGEPKLQEDDQLKMKRVINSPFLIVQSKEDSRYYLSGGKFWYSSSSIKEGWSNTTKLPASIQQLDKQLKEKEKQATSNDEDKTPQAIVVSTEPAELIQSKGEADFKSIQGTSLLYMANTDDEIFMDINQQVYYVLLSGRWYLASSLKGPWAYVAADKLPADFQKIPEGSEKDNVLSSVAGTQASKEAVMDAQIPQTAKVDRKTATCTVKYDGEPKFEKIDGTSMALAMNTSSTVIQSGKKYYCVENGVWFESTTAKGPWTVSAERPSDVDNIPASSTAYNVKYVYIYDTTPEYVYVGYTPGYMGCYVYGTTVVYGTGYYYSPWYGPYYYPRPVTYGFSMHYNPWTGWSMGFHYSAGFFHMSFYGGGGYWGPPMYRPPYHPPYHGGYYGRNTINHYGNTNINIDRSNNIYNNRKDVSTRDVQRGNTAGTKDRMAPGTRDQNAERNKAGQQPAAQRPQNNVMTDRQGNVYQKNNDGNWQERNNNQWENSNRNNQMDRQQQQRDRGNTRQSNFNQSNRGGGMGGGMSRGGGGRRR
ncbi:MAG: hypothetical protein JNM57_07620 [Cyclobacteriaceae bacterium]|nr:hypothetical protein [Cyclobacteriaceae bacterium]